MSSLVAINFHHTYIYPHSIPLVYLTTFTLFKKNISSIVALVHFWCILYFSLFLKYLGFELRSGSGL
jgi:hypothetical protein